MFFPKMPHTLMLLLLRIQFFLEIANYPFRKQSLNNKMSGSTAAVDSPLASTIRPKRQGR